MYKQSDIRSYIYLEITRSNKKGVIHFQADKHWVRHLVKLKFTKVNDSTYKVWKRERHRQTDIF